MSEILLICHVSRMPQERLPKQALLAKVKGKHCGMTANTLDWIHSRYWMELHGNSLKAKWWRWWQNVVCGSILRCSPSTLTNMSGF